MASAASTVPVAAPAEALARLRQQLAQAQADGRRFLLGLVGAPGAGKSTLAQALVEGLNAAGDSARLVPMDGFHLAQAELERLGRAERKGAPDTFDAHGYVALLRRLRTPLPDEVVYAPEFRRELEEPVAGALAVPPAVSCVVTEGNYLLMDTPGWREVRPLLDEVWYVETDDALRVQRLVARHQQFGRSADAAQAWVMRSDEANARLIETTRQCADRVWRWGTGWVA
ncbi:nucleoside triphosphate hydrolase [Hydrogenophaga soli]